MKRSLHWQRDGFGLGNLVGARVSGGAMFSGFRLLTLFLTSTLLALSPPVAHSKPRSTKPAASDSTQQKAAFALYRANKWAEAEQALLRCVARDPLDASLNYYLGMSALYAKHYDVAERAFCRVIVMSPPNTSFARSAQQALSGWRTQFRGLNQPYSQVPEGLSRWSRNRGPIKVCVTDGLQLPKGFYGPQLNTDKCRSLYRPMRQSSFFAKLGRAPGYVPAYRDAVLRGVNDWAFLKKEGIVSFEVIDDPTRADVIYVWCEEHGGGHVGMAYFPWTGVADSRCILEIETKAPNSWGANAPIRLRETSAHEFGHILGLATHSPNINDIMCGRGKVIPYWQSRQYSNTSPVTRNDYITIRALYELPVEVYEPQKW